MALIALSSYKTDEKVMNAIKLGLNYINTNQGKYGDFYSNGKESSIALSYVIIALCSLGINVDTPEFNPISENLAQLLLHKYNNIDGSFSDELNGEKSLFATQLSISALSRVKNNKCPFKLDFPLVVTQVEISENVSTTDKKQMLNL